MAHVRRLTWVLVSLALAVAGWTFVIPSPAIASLSLPPNKSADHLASPLLTSLTGQLPPPRVISFPRRGSAHVSAVSAAPRFRARDDVAFFRKKQESSSASTTPDARALRVSTVGLAASSAPTAETVELSFPGMSYELQTNQPYGADQRVWPPDTQIAVGDTYVVEFVNNSASIWTKSGQIYAISDLNEFFITSVDAKQFSVSNPRIYYDVSSGVWFSSAMAYDAFNNGRVYLNVSLTSDPSGFWYQYTISSNNRGTLYDQPRLGISMDKIVMTWDDFAFSGFTGSEMWVLDKAEIIAGTGTPSFSAAGPDLSRFAVMPSTPLTPSTTEYLVYNNADENGSNYQDTPTLGIIAISGTPARANVAVNEYFAQIPGGANTVVPPDAAQPNGGPPVATNDDRIQAAVSQNGILWAAGNDGCVPNGDTLQRSCLRLFQVSTTGSGPQIVQSFDIGSGGAFFSFPSIALDAAGNVFLGFSGSSAVSFPSFLTSVLRNGGAPAEAESVTVLQPGVGIYNDCAPTCTLSPSNNNRWGDYGGAALDPSNPSSVWLAGEYAASATNPLDWGTGIARVSLGTRVATATSTVSTTPAATVTASPTYTPPEESLTPTPTATGDISTGPQTPSPTSTATPYWIDVPLGQPTEIATVLGIHSITISIPSGETIARIGLSIPGTQIPIVPADPSLQALSGADVVIVAVDASGNPIATLAAPLSIAISFKPLPGDNVNPMLAQIFTLDNGEPQRLTTTVTGPASYGTYVATTTTNRLSSFVIFAPVVVPPQPRSYLPVITSAAQSSGW